MTGVKREIESKFVQEKMKIIKDHVFFSNLEKSDQAFKRYGLSILKKTRKTLQQPYNDVPAEHLEKFHDLLNEHIDAMTDGLLKDVNTIGLGIGFSGGRPQLFHTDYRPESEMVNLYLLMIYTGIKRIVRCSGCQKAFFSGNVLKQSCSGTCRKRKSLARRGSK